jgi:pyridoxal phosphate enzyme (YggS family)
VTLDRADVLSNLEQIREKISAACERSDRAPDRVRIVAAAKGVPLDAISWVVREGVPDIGQNYVAELRRTSREVVGARCHFIGNLQSGTVRHVAVAADVVQTLASAVATQKLSRRAEELGREIDCLIQVDFTGERTGVPPEGLEGFADVVEGLEGLRLVGLMTLHPMPERPEDARRHFVRLRELREELSRSHPAVLETSMGMSFDYEVAVEEGATMVRIGTALFGPRAQSR